VDRTSDKRMHFVALEDFMLVAFVSMLHRDQRAARERQPEAKI
jgi:hypothetical protein